MKKNKLIILLIATTILLSCSKEGPKLLKGQYSGSYYYRGPNMATPVKSSNEITVKFEQGNRYTSSGFQDKKPAGGSGDYNVLKKNFVEFTDRNAWTAEFDWKLILNGSFTYEINGDSLILTRYIEPCPQCSMLPSLYQYRLKRIN